VGVNVVKGGGKRKTPNLGNGENYCLDPVNLIISRLARLTPTLDLKIQKECFVLKEALFKQGVRMAPFEISSFPSLPIEDFLMGLFLSWKRSFEVLKEQKESNWDTFENLLMPILWNANKNW